MTEPMKTAREQIDEDLKLYGVAYIRNHSNGTMERLPPDEIIVRYNSNSKISREVAAERERIKKEIDKFNSMLSKYRLKLEVLPSGEFDMINLF